MQQIQESWFLNQKQEGQGMTRDIQAKHWRAQNCVQQAPVTVRVKAGGLTPSSLPGPHSPRQRPEGRLWKEKRGQSLFPWGSRSRLALRLDTLLGPPHLAPSLSFDGRCRGTRPSWVSCASTSPGICVESNTRQALRDCFLSNKWLTDIGNLTDCLNALPCVLFPAPSSHFS